MHQKKKIAVLGATGSIGRSTLDVVRLERERFEVHSLAGGSRIEPLVEAAREFGVKRVAIADAAKHDELARALREAGLGKTEVLAGERAAAELAADPDADMVLHAVVGAAGLRPAFAAAAAGKRLLLANKESVVCGGELLMNAVKMGGADLYPVDSEHSAIFQCLAGAGEEARRGARLILTASGGPFRGRRDLSGITPAMAVKHPKWSMGRKISVDSATLMNKGLEVIEASWLFGFPADRIDVVVHPESIVHSMVEYADGSVIAQLAMPDMKTPIALAMGWPERIDGGTAKLSLAKIGSLTFEEPDREVFPLLDIACRALREGGAATIVLNAADEEAVAAFLDERIGFTDIFRVVEETLEDCAGLGAPRSLEEIFEADCSARRAARLIIERLA